MTKEENPKPSAEALPRAERRRQKKEQEKKEKMAAQLAKQHAKAMMYRVGKNPNPKRTLSFRQRLSVIEQALLRQSMISGALGRKLERIEEILGDVTIDAKNKVVAGEAWEKWNEEREKAKADAQRGPEDTGGEPVAETGDDNPAEDVPEGAEEVEGDNPPAKEDGGASGSDDD